MKQICVILCTVLFSLGITGDVFGFAFERQGFDKNNFVTEKEDIIKEDSFWEKSSDDVSISPNGKNVTTESDDERRLYGPPPGEEGNPQKIVVPLGNDELPFFLLLSVLAIGFYCFRHSRLKKSNSENAY